MIYQGFTLFGYGKYKGKVIHGGIDCEYLCDENPVLVLPHGGIEYYNTMVYTARKNKGKLLVILERGGNTCHLVVNAKEKDGISIILLRNALHLLEQNTIIQADMEFATIST